MSPSGIYTQNMFLSRPQDKPSVELTAAEAVAVSEMAQVGDPSCSQSGCVRNFDINRLPSGEEEEEEEEEETGGSSSAVSIVSPFLSPLSNTSDKESDHHDHHNDHTTTTTTTTTITAPIHVYTAPASREEEEGDVPGIPPRKKLRLSKEQSALLEESFREHHTLNPKQKSALAKQLNLKSRQVEVWFQNRRARTKLKQTEVDCEFLKRCCESLTEENRRLQRELEELRAIKVSPPACLISAQDLYMPMTMPMPMPLPAATLTMCPSCERMGTTIDKRALTFAKPSYYVTNFRQPSAAC